VRVGLAAGMWVLAAWLSLPAQAATLHLDDQIFDVQALLAPLSDASAATVTGGVLDSQFVPFSLRDARQHGGAFWLKLLAKQDVPAAEVPALVVHKGRHLIIQVFTTAVAGSTPLGQVDDLPSFRAAQDMVFALPAGLTSGQVLYAHVDIEGRGSEELSFATAPLQALLEHGEDRTRMIALAFGALMAMSLAALFLWFVLADRLFILYSLLISFQALYVVYFTGQGFDWPWLSWALPLASYAWNVPAALSGAASCLFVREIADLRRFSPRVYRIFGWMSVTFVVLAFSNLAQLIGLGSVVAAIGNLIFLGAAAFTLIVAFLAWRRGNRASGFFLLAWGLLEAVTIATTVRLLIADADNSDRMLFYGLPLSMVTAAILIALGVADRLRGQRLALSEAEQRAQTDPLTGVLNRRALVERLELACARARARGLPIALLFLDLDHFKEINDSFGHPAGDACLSAVIAPIAAELRQSDIIGRYGGEEFVVILSSANATAAHAIAERIRERVAAVRVEGFGLPIRLTCSIGVAASDTLGVWGQHLIAQADAAVYAAKRAGRNCVQVAVPLAA
jgi:diguanylate cyclase (GGDEF)-like protein